MIPEERLTPELREGRRLARMLAGVCPLCGYKIGERCDGSEASHDGDGHEPCVNGHYDCSTSGRTGGPCRNEGGLG